MKFAKLRAIRSIHPPVPWHRSKHRQAGGDLIVLLHGLWRSYLSMEKLAEALNEAGFETLNIPYPSFRHSVDDLISRIDEEIEQVDTGKKLHFVTHSLGGVLTRHYVDRFPHRQFGRAVMLAPPHRGSEIVDWLEGSPLLNLLGPAGACLSTVRMKKIESKSAKGMEVLVFMGTKARIPFLHVLLSSENDGIVSVTSCALLEEWTYRQVQADHTFIMQRDDVIEETCSFLRSGPNG